jgi:glycogen debranching enzyme
MTYPGFEALSAEARDVLVANRVGAYTGPAPGLYAHQWSWDSAFIAIGLATFDIERARTELASAFRAQWRNGMLPQITYRPGVEGYSPGPSLWQTERSPNAPSGFETSGITQHPLHTVAAWSIHERATDEEASLAWLRKMLPALERWHDYLHRERDPEGSGLVAVRHPWESWDDAPAWGTVLAGIDSARDAAVSRPDRDHVADAERPDDEAYARHAQLATLARDLDFDETAIREASPFLVEDVMFNSVLVAADRALAHISQAVGASPARHLERAARGAAALNEQLWSEEEGLYLARDRRSGRHLGVRHLTGFLPLFAGVPDAPRAQRLLEELASPGFGTSACGWVMAGCDRREPGFDPESSCRGPIWVNLNWMLARGLEDATARLGDDRFAYKAAQVDAATIGLIAREGFRESFHTETGRGLGAEGFSWTAALLLDLLARR